MDIRFSARFTPSARRKNEAGENEWLLYDPLRHQYFALGRTALLLLRYLPKISSLEDLKNSLAKDDATVDDHEIEQFLTFLSDNFLSVGSSIEHVERIKAAQKARQRHWFMWLVHNYLFIKIPLIRPDRFLNGLLRIFSPIWKTRAQQFTFLAHTAFYPFFGNGMPF